MSFRLLLVLSIPIKDRIYDRVGLIPHETLNRLCARTVFIGFVLCKRFRRADGLKNGVEPTPHRITLRPPKVAVSPRVHDRSLNLPPIRDNLADITLHIISLPRIHVRYVEINVIFREQSFKLFVLR